MYTLTSLTPSLPLSLSPPLLLSLSLSHSLTHTHTHTLSLSHACARARACERERAHARTRVSASAYRHSIKANSSIILWYCDSQQACALMDRIIQGLPGRLAHRGTPAHQARKRAQRNSTTQSKRTCMHCALASPCHNDNHDLIRRA